MPIASVFDMTGAKTGEMELNAAVFGIEPNEVVRSSGPEAEILQLLAEQEDQASGSALRTVR